MPMVAMIQRPGRIKNATRDILPPRLATTRSTRTGSCRAGPSLTTVLSSIPAIFTNARSWPPVIPAALVYATLIVNASASPYCGRCLGL